MTSSLADLAKESARSTFWLTIGQGISSSIGAIIVIYIARTLQSELYGLYSVSLIPSNIGAILAALGIPSAVTAYMARDYLKDPNLASKWFTAGLVIELINGSVITSIIFVFAKQISVVFLGKPQAEPYVALASLLVVSIALFNIGYGALNALYLTKFIAVSQIIGALVRGFTTIYLIYTGYGVTGAIVGFISYYVVAAVLEFLFILIELARYKIGLSLGGIGYFKGLFSYGVPLAIASVLQVIGINLVSGLTSKYESLEVLGNYFAANSLMVIMIIFNQPILQALVPSFSRVTASNNSDAGLAFSASITISALLLSPILFIVMGLSEPMIYFLYGESYRLAPIFLSVLPLTFLPNILGLTSSASLLLGSGKTKAIFLYGSISLALSLIAGFLLIPIYGVWGLIFSIGVMNFLLLFFYLFYIGNSFGYKPNYSRLIKIIISSALSFIILRLYVLLAMKHILFLFSSIIHLGELSSIIFYFLIDVLGGVIGLIIYVASLIAVRGLGVRDVDVLIMVSERLGPIRKPFIIILNILKRVLIKLSG